MSDSAQKSTTTTQQKLRGRKSIAKKIDKEEEIENENSQEEEDEGEEMSIATRIKSLRRSTNRTNRLNCYVYNNNNNNNNENNDDLVDENTNIKQEQQQNQKQNKKQTKAAKNVKKTKNQKQTSPNTSDTSMNNGRKGSRLSVKRNHRLDNSMSTGGNKIYLENKKFAESIIDKECDEMTNNMSKSEQNTTNEYDFDEDVGDDDDDDDYVECNNTTTTTTTKSNNNKVKNLRKSLEEQMLNQEQQTTTTTTASKSGAGGGSVIKTNNNNNETNKDGCFINPQLAAFNFGNLFYCNFCGYSANNTNKILHHLFVHVFKCNLCSHFTYTKYDLMKHIYKCHRPNKELRIKRLVLEVTSNDWYFLCSENDAHCISNTLSDNDDMNNIKVSSGGTPAKSSSSSSSAAYSQSKSASSNITPPQNVKTSKKSGVGGGGGDSKSNKLTSILKSCIETNHDTSTNTSNDNSINVLNDSGQKKKPVMNYFVTKVEKKPEKITPVIQSNKISSSSTTTNNETTTTTTTAATTTSGDRNNTQQTSIDAVDSRPAPTVTAQSQQQKSSKLTEILLSGSDILKLTSDEPKVTKTKKTQASANEADATPASATPSRSTRSKRVPPPKKYTPECTEFSTETKKDLESIKNKYTNMECRYTCKQCKYEATSAVMAYTHLVISNQEHNLKCFVCDCYTSDNVCSYKMHLLSKHKVYASADKLFHEYFTIIDTLTKEPVLIESPLTSIKLSITITADENHPSSTPISTKPSGVKRNLIESDNVTSESNDETEQVAAVTSSKRKKLFDNDKEKEAKNTQSTLESMSYETETLDDGSTIYICSKCKLVFLKTQAFIEHKCYNSTTTNASSVKSQKKSQDKVQKSASNNNNTSNNSKNNSKYNSLNEFFSITRSTILNKSDTGKQQQQHNLSDSNDECGGDDDDDDDEERIQIADYDNIKNNSDVIYIDD